MAKESNFSLLIKNNSEENFEILAFDGYILIHNLDRKSNLKINFTHFELFYQAFIVIIDFFLNNRDFTLNELSYILETSSFHYAWLPSMNEQGIKTASLIVIDKLKATNEFEIHFDSENFLCFLKSFSSCILSCLLLKIDEKLIFNTFFHNEFDWNEFKSNTFNETYLLTYVMKQKTQFNLQVDISNILFSFKVYYPLLLILHQTNELLLLDFNEASHNVDVQSPRILHLEENLQIDDHIPISLTETL